MTVLLSDLVATEWRMLTCVHNIVYGMADPHVDSPQSHLIAELIKRATALPAWLQDETSAPYQSVPWEPALQPLRKELIELARNQAQLPEPNVDISAEDSIAPGRDLSLILKTCYLLNRLSRSEARPNTATWRQLCDGFLMTIFTIDQEHLHSEYL
ncbi:hypothetical protein BOTBODRAFT_173006 [Botryobasidium botryosum FD-172 SS1]|uniref:Uncharacterized protein n=1 Tax=Botryobasidium botryosum (strain FD-172 SS1) TaxID=930990 RepID=A0A067ML43_BOTB1|nr:hypothetical protein BOTBODRAFT_173006 [Botryobasidium botryosum FD-172 SS1]